MTLCPNFASTHLFTLIDAHIKHRNFHVKGVISDRFSLCRSRSRVAFGVSVTGVSPPWPWKYLVHDVIEFLFHRSYFIDLFYYIYRALNAIALISFAQFCIVGIAFNIFGAFSPIQTCTWDWFFLFYLEGFECICSFVASIMSELGFIFECLN